MTSGLAAEIDARAEGRTIVSMFLDTVAAVPDQVALRWKVGEGWGELTWREYAEQAARVAGALLATGIDEGDRVVLMLRNRPEFHVADVGVLLAGATPISIYNSSSAEQVAYLAGHAKARIAIVEDAFLDVVEEASAAVPSLERIIVVGDGGSWAELVGSEPVDLEAAAAASHPEGLATVIYTSGTTGPPKGVQITHRNVVWTVESYREVAGDVRGLRGVSYLPMAHIAERMTSHYLAIACGFQVTTCPDLSLIHI